MDLNVIVSVLIKREARGRFDYRREVNVVTEAGIGEVHPQSREHRQPRSRKRHEIDTPLEPAEGTGSANILILVLLRPTADF